MNYVLKAVFLTLTAVLLFSCSKSNDKASIIDPRTGKHLAEWAVADTGGAHPAAFIAGPSACYECHGKDLSGGISKVSCFSASRSGITCHAGGPSGHPDGWAAPDVHGAAAKALFAGVKGMPHCQLCHGADFSGGTAKKSCLNTTGCHGAGIMAAHSPKPWLSTIGGRTHSSSDPTNAAACAVCHSNGANSSRTPAPAAPAGTVPGCFNNTLCHGVKGHAFASWTSAKLHGAAAKAAEGGITVNGQYSPVSSFGNCAQCHGTTYDGGAAEQTCLNTAGCHGANVASPHPARPWRSTTGGVTHATTDTSNAGQCAVCHTNGSNSTRAPQAGDATGSSGCFNNTLCHGAEGHSAGWKAFDQHGAAAKLIPGTKTGFSYCQNCHGSTFNNGSAPSCMNNILCHSLLKSSPHPVKPWTSAVAGTPTHTTTDPANAGTCAICHTGGANSDVVPPNPATGTAGCYNNTLCHFHTIPFKPPGVDPSVHGTQFAKPDLTVCQNCHGVKGTSSFNGLALGGGVTTIACSSCHTFAKAHPTAWQGSTTNPGETVIYSHRTAGNRANACTLCHDVSQGRTAPLAAAPSCFSTKFTNGLNQTGTCHALGPGVAPHTVPYPNHNATARSDFSYCLGCHQVDVNFTTPSGKVIPRCQTCHLTSPVATPTGCTSCHAIPPGGTIYPDNANVHAQHITGVKLTVMTLVCADCHNGLGFSTLDHLNRARARTITGRANPVVFGSGTLVAGSAYTDSNGQCANVYCHGAKMPGSDITGTNRTPVWSTPFLPATISAAACGTCHGFPPLPASGHPVVGTIPAGFPTTASIGTTCSCHSNINTAGNSYANIFVEPAIHINGAIEVSGAAAGHGGAPYDTHNAAVVAAGGNTECLGCHAIGTAASVYPATTAGNPPDCMGCHKKAAPLHVGTTAGANCSSCHGLSTALTTRIGRPNTNPGTFPDNQKNHNRGEHIVACTTCHILGTSGGTGSGINHGRGSIAGPSGPVRDGKQGVVGPFTAGITVTTSGSKGVAPSISCDHGSITGSGCSGGPSTAQTW